MWGRYGHKGVDEGDFCVIGPVAGCVFEGIQSKDRLKTVLSGRSLLSKVKIHSQEGWRASCLETRSSSTIRVGVGF